ncbi:MAG: Dabb family protein [Oscillospiraceae bacterium]|nr:Dabb family protein [Oscillospiraceae bacterium]
MIRHIVCWKLKDENKKENVARMKKELESLVGRIEGLVSLEVGECFEGSSWDAALDSTFESSDALEFYRTHREHVKVADFIQTIMLERTAADYEM